VSLHGIFFSMLESDFACLVFAVIAWSFFPIIFCLYPETSRRTLEDMDEIFIRHPSPIVCGKQELTQRKRPQTFVDAERDRIMENKEFGKETAKGGTTAHYEHV
jgi:hypothetical protein